MSICSWGVCGMGVNIEGDTLDFKKVVKELNLDKSMYEVDNNALAYLEDKNGLYVGKDEIIDEIMSKDEFKKWEGLLCYTSTGEAYNGEFFYYSPNYPWHLTEVEKTLTKEIVVNAIVEILLRITVLSEAEIRGRIENISTGGMG